MITTLSLDAGVTLRCFRDTRFKQGCLSIQFLQPVQAECLAENALIPAVLLRGTRQHPDLRSITQHLDMLYGAAVSPLVRRVGDYQAVGLVCGFMDDRFALKGDRVLEPVLDFLQELLLDFPVENDGFPVEFVESEKKNQISAIEAEGNDKRIYCMSQLLKRMCRGDSFALPRLGEPADIEKITPRSLLKRYRTLLETAPVDIFYVGSAQPETVAQLLAPMFRGISRTPAILPEQTPLQHANAIDFTEALEITQGKLCMGFTTPCRTGTPEFAAMQVFNVLYGGGMTSKLFQNVREKQSLCYSVNSGFYSAKGLVLVSAGIDFDKEPAARAEILRQLALCRQGEISQEELNAAKQAILSSLRSTHDSPGAIESYYQTGFLGGHPMTTAQHMEKVEAVTVDDVIRAANSMQLTASCFLKGVHA